LACNRYHFFGSDDDDDDGNNTTTKKMPKRGKAGKALLATLFTEGEVDIKQSSAHRIGSGTGQRGPSVETRYLE
jgi:hypothetical protein